MPRVEVDLPIAVPPAAAWAAVVDVERYPDCMDNVEDVTLTAQADAGHRTTAWSVRLKGSVLRWTEDEVIDHDARRFDFRQVSGDLGEFVGHWGVSRAEGGNSVVSLHVDFDIGIPLLADMLNPVAADALRENAAQMLTSLERRLVTADGESAADPGARPEAVSRTGPQAEAEPEANAGAGTGTGAGQEVVAP